MHREKRTLATLAFLVVLAGCNSSGGGNDSNDGDDSDDNTSPPADTSALTPAEVLTATASLNYQTRYNGESNWADPVAVNDRSDPAGQPQRRVIDTSMLGAALSVAPYWLAERGMEDQGLAPLSIFDFIEISGCGTGCIQSPTADNAEITVSQDSVTWDTDAPEPFSAVAEITGLDLTWRGEDFQLDGALGLIEDFDQLHLAFDVIHTGTGTRYRYWMVHKYGLSTTNPQIDLVGFHPQEGAVVTPAESYFAADAGCAQGGFESEEVALLNRQSASDATAELYFGFLGCDIYFLDSTFSQDADGNPVQPNLFAAYRSLGLDFDQPVAEWPGEPDEHYQLGQDQADQFLTPENVEVAKLGSERNGNDWTLYEIALSFDPAQLPAGLVGDDIEAAMVRLYQSGVGADGAVPGIVSAVLKEWTGTPESTDFVGMPAQSDLTATVSGGPDTPWGYFDATGMVKTVFDESRTRLQVVITVMIVGEPDEGDVYQLFCLKAGNECDAGQLPALNVAHVAP